ncbi:MAG: chemotaxis protein CheB [Comamonadaceae bacterium]|nr:MAG: chemotaxis protein CheB [Comamonadaceae bacterium]
MSAAVSLGSQRIDAIVIGGSAGSIEALAILLPALPVHLRAAVFAVLHLPRERPSLLCDIFQPRCAVPLREAQDKEPAEPGTVYFAPPDYHLLIDAGPSVALSIDEPVHFSRPSIDVLFESAADVYGNALMAVLLSGANHDGAEGLAAVQAAGGTTVVQDPGTAPMSTMPEAALSLIQPDHVLTPLQIAALFAQLPHGRTL